MKFIGGCLAVLGVVLMGRALVGGAGFTLQSMAPAILCGLVGIKLLGSE